MAPFHAPPYRRRRPAYTRLILKVVVMVVTVVVVGPVSGSGGGVFVVAAAAAGEVAHSKAEEQQDKRDEGLDFFDLKCSACVSIVAELERNLETEKPRMNVDLRRTLGSGKDKRGRTIDYAVSEMRTLEVLEGLCGGMRDYGVAQQDDGSAAFQRFNVHGGSMRIGGALTIGGDKHRADVTRLEAFCYSLVEEHEDALSEAIRAAGLAKKARDDDAARKARAKRKKGARAKVTTAEAAAAGGGGNEGAGEDNEADAEEAEESDPYKVLGLEPPPPPGEGGEGAAEHLARVRQAYRRLSRQHHPDKVSQQLQQRQRRGGPGGPSGALDGVDGSGADGSGADGSAAVGRFVALSAAYEAITGDAVTPYGDLYRQVCIELAAVCGSEPEVDAYKFYLPRYDGSAKFGQAQAGGLDLNPDGGGGGGTKKQTKRKKRAQNKKKGTKKKPGTDKYPNSGEL